MDNKTICKQAEIALLGAKNNPKKLVMLYAGVTGLLVLLLAIVDFSLNSMIGTTAGLSGMGMRAVLSTMQTVLQRTQQILLPFWGFGYTYAMLRISRNEDFSYRSLLMGFRCFLPLFCGVLLVTLSIAAAAIILSYASVLVLSLTPFADGMTELSQQILQSGGQIDDALAQQILVTARPLVIAGTVISALGAFYVSYRYRMVFLSILDEPKSGPFLALRKSRIMMRGNKKRLFSLDLHFWWYYFLLVLLAAVAYGDLLLPMLGIDLAMSGTVGFFLFYVLYLVGQFALTVYCRNRIAVAYALFYNDLKSKWEEDVVRF